MLSQSGGDVAVVSDSAHQLSSLANSGEVEHCCGHALPSPYGAERRVDVVAQSTGAGLETVVQPHFDLFATQFNNWLPLCVFSPGSTGVGVGCIVPVLEGALRVRFSAIANTAGSATQGVSGATSHSDGSSVASTAVLSRVSGSRGRTFVAVGRWFLRSSSTTQQHSSWQSSHAASTRMTDCGHSVKFFLGFYPYNPSLGGSDW